MRRFSVCVAGLLATAFLGCGPGKELPDELPTPTVGPTPPASGDPLGSPPAASDPAAKAAVERAIKAISENDPKKLEKAKVVRVTYQGATQMPNHPETLTVNRRVEIVWPDRGRVDEDYKDKSLNPMSYRLRGPHGWVLSGARMMDGVPAEFGRIIRNDLTAEHGVELGLALAEPQATIYDPVTNEAGTTVKLAIPDRPVYRVTFDAKSGLPVRVEYEPVEGPQRVHKLFEFGDHKSTNGMMLPTSVRLTQNRTLAWRMAVQSWEFPEKIEESQFDRPQQ